MATEAQITSRLLSRLRKAKPGAFVWKINTQMRGGIPDALIVGTRGRAWFEFKRGVGDPRTALTAQQRATCAQLVALGEMVYVVALHDGGTSVVYDFRWSIPLGDFLTVAEAFC